MFLYLQLSTDNADAHANCKVKINIFITKNVLLFST